MHGHHDIYNFEHQFLEPLDTFLARNSKSFSKNINALLRFVLVFGLHRPIQSPKCILNSGQFYDFFSVLNSLCLFQDWFYLERYLWGFIGAVKIDKGGVERLNDRLFFKGFELFFEMRYFLLEFFDVELFSLPGFFCSEFRLFGDLLDSKISFVGRLNFRRVWFAWGEFLFVVVRGPLVGRIGLFLRRHKRQII